MRYRLTNSQEIELITDYNANILTKIEIRKKYEIYPNTFCDTLRRHNILNKRRRIDAPNLKYSYDNNVFKSIDTEEKAYWLGFLMADGCVSNNNSRWTLQLTTIDKDIADKFKEFLKTNTPIKHENNSTVDIKRQDTYTLYVNNKEIIEDIMKYGIVNHKSYRTYLPDISQELIRHFIRGYFDADGCLYTRPNIKVNRSEVSITSASMLVLEQIQKHLQNINLIRPRNYIRKRKDSYSTLIIDNRLEALAILDYMYGKSSIFMNRKYNKYKLVTSRPFKVKKDNCSSIYIGVNYNKYGYNKKWTANLQSKFIGNFHTPEEAAIAYNNKVTELKLDNYPLNQIREIA